MDIRTTLNLAINVDMLLTFHWYCDVARSQLNVLYLIIQHVHGGI